MLKFRWHRWKGEYRGENVRFAPLIKLGNLDSLACLGESGGDSPPASLADNDLPSLYGGPGAKPGKISPEGAV